MITQGNMIREVVKIDEDKCTGCGICVPNCHEGALQIIDGKARLISDLLCDGLGACLGHCPEDAITIEKREAEAYNETSVMEIMVTKGKNTVIAHLKHLKDHQEHVYLKEGIDYLKSKNGSLPFELKQVLDGINKEENQNAMHRHHGGGCPGSREQTFKPVGMAIGESVSGQSQLQQWPVQMHLVNPNAQFFQGADVVLAADCVGYTLGNFHDKYLKGKSLAIACPKLDSGTETYIEKLTAMIDNAKINTLNVMIMEVPCCSGLLQMVQIALDKANRKVPLKLSLVSIKGEILSEDWI